MALRVYQLDGDYRDRDPDSMETHDMFDFGTIVQPKFNIVYSPSDMINVFANAGRSFQQPFSMSLNFQSPAGSNRWHHLFIEPKK